MRRIIVYLSLSSFLACPATFANQEDGTTVTRGDGRHGIAEERYSTARCLSGSTVERFDDRDVAAPLAARRKCLV